MSTVLPQRSPQLGILFGLDRRRIGRSVRNPTLSAIASVGLPLVLLVGALVVIGRSRGIGFQGAGEGLTLGMLIAGGISFLSYGVLYRAHDDAFLRRMGTDPGAMFTERAVRLAVLGIGMSIGLTIPFAVAGDSSARVLTVGIACSAIAVGVSAVTLAAAARAMTAQGRGSGLLGMGLRGRDPEMAAAAPLLYAPLVPFLAGGGYGALANASPTGGPTLLWMLIGVAAGAAGVGMGAHIFRPVAARFYPRTGEMAYAPPAEGRQDSLAMGRGLQRFLPRGTAAVWVRDATVAGRRYPWSGRVSWPIGIAAIVALARWGDADATRIWVVVAVGLALIIQSAAVIGMGMLERQSTRWIDRGTGLSSGSRLLGRWAWAWGLSLWLVVPVGLAWSWWSGVGGGWLWPFAALVIAGVASVVSIFQATRV